MSEVYIEQNLERKNQIAESTIKFIETQLDLIADTLSKTQMQLMEFKRIMFLEPQQNCRNT